MQFFFPKKMDGNENGGEMNHFGPKLVCDITWHVKLLWELILDLKNQTHELLVWTTNVVFPLHHLNAKKTHNLWGKRGSFFQYPIYHKEKFMDP